jgi:anti-anti-sigma factor
MAIAEYSDEKSTVVWLRGEHDAATAGDLSEAIARAIALDRADLIIDMSEVEFMSCATAGVLVRTQNFLRLRSRALTVRLPSSCARRVLGLCGLTGLIDETAQPMEARQIA